MKHSSTKKAVTKKDIRKLVLHKIEEGKSQQEIFEEIKQEVRNPAREIAQQVRSIATLDKRNNYKTAHAVLVILLAIIVLFKVLTGVFVVIENGIRWTPMIIAYPFIYIIILYGVIKYRGFYFKFAAAFLLVGNLKPLLQLFTEGFKPMLVIDLIFAAVVVALCIYLSKKMFPDFKAIKEKYTNSNGQNRLKLKIIFSD